MKNKLLIFVFLLIAAFCFAGQNDNSLLFDGDGDFVVFPHNAAYNVSAITIEMWVFWSGNDIGFLVAKDYEELEIHTSPDYSLRFIPTDFVYLDTPAGSFLPNMWNHVAMIYNPSVSFAQCFINGVDISLTNVGPNPLSSAITNSIEPVYLGRRGAESYYFNGKIANLRVWNTVRTQQEIIDNMHSDIVDAGPELVLYAKLDEGVNTIANDSSILGNTGFIANAIWQVEDGSLPVELSSFTATLTATETAEIKWVSQTETDLLGYNVFRAQDETISNAVRVNPAIITAHNSSHASTYSFEDTDLNVAENYGKIVYYWLESINFDGSQNLHGPAQVVLKKDEVKAPGAELVSHMKSVYPNPFNPETNIAFDITEGETGTVKVYNSKGQLVKNLGIFEAGSHVVNWNGKSNDNEEVSTGIYFFSFVTKTSKEIKKAVLIK